ncbi:MULTISPECIES: hypothetical protein [unclassified Duganella]|uniref:hypothetical protein n=1 Tax=unclassified Duganella TaxID=2636909 RepID=UPI000E3437D4|nr:MULTISPECIES: hypothetical protein [unclassified Duganella]RFP11304.1 hypothetical protein D0T23_20515 [Duganella sp. BJB475]RFP29623.1 hypothetical protein D0T21_17270 [Duganella sp. BJB476]
MDTFRVAKYAMAIAAVLQACAGQAFAQQSAYADLDACTKNEQIKLTAKGAAVGALAGLGGALFSGNKDKAGKAALAGALGGGAIGFATAYYTAIDTCNKLNPSWVTESKLVRDPSKTYTQVVKENRYAAKDGVTLRLRDMAMPSQTKPGERVTIDTVYDLMTPDGAETAVVFSRKLFVVADGTEQLVQFPVAASESRTVEVGRSKESMVLPIAPDSKPGTVYRVEISAAAGGKTPVTMSKSVTVI